jgi:bifunctional non-homologous end joining protein LigD
MLIGITRGSLDFELQGERLKGRWHLVRLRNGGGKHENWLLIRAKDDHAPPHGDAAIEQYQTSVISRRGMEGIEKAVGRSWGRGRARPTSSTEAAEAVRAATEALAALTAQGPGPALGINRGYSLLLRLGHLQFLN